MSLSHSLALALVVGSATLTGSLPGIDASTTIQTTPREERFQGLPLAFGKEAVDSSTGLQTAGIGPCLEPNGLS